MWTTFSADQVDLNFKEPRVLLAALEVLLFYAAQGAGFIRLDAIAFLWKEIGTSCLHLPQTHAVIQLMRAVLDVAAPEVLLITETNVPHGDNISYFGDGTNEAQLVYNFALPPLVLHSLATGNAEKLTRWAQALALPSDRVTFFNFLASHDGIGLNPARGILSDAEIDGLVGRTLKHGGLHFLQEHAGWFTGALRNEHQLPGRTVGSSRGRGCGASGPESPRGPRHDAKSAGDARHLLSLALRLARRPGGGRSEWHSAADQPHEAGSGADSRRRSTGRVRCGAASLPG